ncbi:MAG: glyoxylase-like metal-dependent hydrolase (beta-lactamase superfamily II) [Bacteroidia bacterium]
MLSFSLMSEPKISRSNCISVNEYPGGVLCVDSGFVRDRMASCYLLESDSEVAIIETGTNSSAQRLKEVIRVRGWDKSAVRYVIVTHVHLDHAGGAGALMQEFSDATFLVHPRGAAHMIDPARLEASVRRVYGDETFDATYGTLIPINEKRVRIMEDGDCVQLGDRELLFIDTPGHARHHFCIWDEKTRGWFTGDTFGLSYRELDTVNGAFIFPTTTPIEFDPEALKHSISRLVDKNPESMYLTHYGRVDNVATLAEQMMQGIDAIVEIAERNQHCEDFGVQFKREFTTWLTESIRAHGVTLDESALQKVLLPDIDLNTQGVEVWLNRREK